MDNLSLATLRLGKTSVDDIKKIALLDAGILPSPFSIDVTCTQVPSEADTETYVLIWLGSDNSKGIATEWKQGFKALGMIKGIDRGASYNDNSTLHVNIMYIFQNAVSRLDILQKAQQLYYHCSALPIIGIDDHSNQTVRMLDGIEERGSLNAFFCALNLIDPTFKDSICSINNNFSALFNFKEVSFSTIHSLEHSIADYITKHDDETLTFADLVSIYTKTRSKSVRGNHVSNTNLFGIKYAPHIISLKVPYKGSGSIAYAVLGAEEGSMGDEISRGVQIGIELRKHLGVSHISSRLKFSASSENYDKYLRALRTKPFLLLAGISGTGKSRIVRELAFKSCPEILRDKDGTTPGNYLMIEVKPNWHDSSELLGYYSNIAPGYQYTKFIEFAVKATKYPDVPFFVCLDEMNLAPVEQYFAEFLSVLETRKKVGHSINSGSLVDAKYMKDYPGWGKEEPLTLPDNLFIIGTVNMDDTTHKFSRKVIDRAMTIEMNGGVLRSMFGHSSDMSYLPDSEIWKIESFKPLYVSADEVLEAHPGSETEIKEKLASRLEKINAILDGTPFKVSYRVLNELSIYTAVLLDDGLDIDAAVTQAVDQISLMKILPRIEGDEEMFNIRGEQSNRLEKLMAEVGADSESWKKLDEMNKRLSTGEFTRFWP